MSRFVVGNIFLFGSMFCATASHIMIKGLLDDVQPTALNWATAQQFLTVGRMARGILAGILLVAGFLLWVACLSKLALSYAYPVASTSILLVAVFSIAILGESMGWRMWVGTVLILVGIILIRPDNA